MVVAFTGYRPEKMPFQESKKDKRYLAFRAILSRVISREPLNNSPPNLPNIQSCIK